MPADRTEEHKRKPRKGHAPYQPRKPKEPAVKNVPKTSAQPSKSHTRSNLTLNDWLTVFAYINKHPDLSQDAIVKHFSTRAEGILIFNQSSFSRKLKDRKTLEERAKCYPNALSLCRECIVTRPDVDMALFLWVKHMEEKGESVNGPMLIAKRTRFEDQFNVPQEERLESEGWLGPFKKAYNIKEYCRHGKAGSVDITAVEAERIRLRIILAKYPPKNRFNFDETSFFAFTPPDRGLATEQMSGKKRDKFRITMGIGCNADGSEKLPIIFIGKSAKPQCFKGKKPEAHGFTYRNNKTAWMTMVIFDEWLRGLDLKMQQQNRHICLLVDNFSAHYPCDAGIIRTVKALYRKTFCLRAIEKDEADEREIYKINLLEAILMAKQAWQDVSSSTIINFWNHAGIQPESLDRPSAARGAAVTSNTVTSNTSPIMNYKAWDLVRAFASSPDTMTLPQAEKALQQLLGDSFVKSEWNPIFKIVMDAERDVSKALDGLDKQAAIVFGTSTARISSTHQNPTALPQQQSNLQLADTERDLLKAVDDLKHRKRIIGTPLTLEEILNPVEEKEVGDSLYRFPGGDDDIVVQVNHEMAVKRGEIIEIDDDDEDDRDDGDDTPNFTISEMIKICETMEQLTLEYGNLESRLCLSQGLRKFRIDLRKTQDMTAVQTRLDGWLETAM